MKKISETTSKLSIAFLGVYIYLFLFIVDLPAIDIFMVILVDCLSYIIVGLGIEPIAFRYFFPRHSKILRNFNRSLIEKIKETNDSQVLTDIFSIPAIRAIWFIPLNLVKVIMPGLYFIYFANHNLSLIDAWIYFVSMELFMVTIFSSIAFIELHSFITEFLNKEHKRINLSDAFKQVTFFGSIKQFKYNEHVAIISCCCILILQTVALSTTNTFSQNLNLAVPLIFGLILVGRVYYLYRDYFFNGLEKIIDSFETFRNGEMNLAISSSKLLSRFESTINKLSLDISLRDEEISNWLINETESNRFRTIGEVSARIGHDIKGPFHTIRHCLKEIEVNQQNSKYITAALNNLERAETLTNNLNSHLRDPDNKIYSSILEVHHEVINSLKLELIDLTKINFKLEGLENLTQITLCQSELVSIFYNLYKNSIRNFNENNIENQEIELYVHSIDQNFVELSFVDNGTGLNPEKFEKLTHFYLEEDNKYVNFKRGLGLRLIRKMLEAQNGNFSCIENAREGTHLLIKLPIKAYSNQANNRLRNHLTDSHDWMN